MIKFTYFDLGGVTEIDISTPDRWTKFKRDLGITENQDGEFEEFWNKYEPELCVGREQDSLIPLIEEKFHLQLPENYSILTDFVNRFGVNKSIWPVINEIHKVCRIGILSNMYPHMLDEIKKREILPKEDWDIVIDSSIEGLRKPDSEIYSLAEEKSRAKGNEIFYIDNSQKNIETAIKFNWQTFLYNTENPEESSRNLLNFFNKISKP